MPRFIDADVLIENFKTVTKNFMADKYFSNAKDVESYIKLIRDIITEQPTANVVEVIRCKDCKHFEYDHPYIIQGIPILGHEVCNAWGDGCKTDENGYCFMAERREDE